MRRNPAGLVLLVVVSAAFALSGCKSGREPKGESGAPQQGAAGQNEMLDRPTGQTVPVTITVGSDPIQPTLDATPDPAEIHSGDTIQWTSNRKVELLVPPDWVRFPPGRTFAQPGPPLTGTVIKPSTAAGTTAPYKIGYPDLTGLKQSPSVVIVKALKMIK